MGKGGAGKSTLASATAVAVAETGARVLLVSIDQAHSLDDVLGIRSAGDTVSVTDTLDALALGTLSLLENRFRNLSALLTMLGRHDHGGQLAALEPEELTGLPGVQELLGLREVARLASSGDYDVVVVDCAATADCLRTLAAPTMVTEYIERIWPQHRRIVAAVGPDPRLMMLVSMIERIVSAAEEVRALLVDRESTTLRVVTTAERVVVAEARRTVAVAALSGLHVDAVLVNNLLQHTVSQSDGDHPALGWYAAQRADQQDALTDLSQALAGTPMFCAPRSVTEPVGLADLGAIGAALYPSDVDPAAVLGAETPAVRVGLESGMGLDSVYAMRMYLPLVDPSTLSLGRVEDDLVVGAEGARRRVRLASVLRRCTVAGAELDGSDLVIRFRPDPQVWPA